MSLPTLAHRLTYLSVVLDKGVDQFLDYKIPDDFSKKIIPGMRVIVPLRSQSVCATIIKLKATSPFKKVLPFIKLIDDEPFLNEDQLKLIDWITSYYCSKPRKVLKLFLPSSIKDKAKIKEQFYIESLFSLEKLKQACEKIRQKSPSQAKVLDILLRHPKGLFLSELLEKAKTSKSPIENLIKQKVLLQKKIHIDRSDLLDCEYFLTQPKKLNHEQKKALESIKTSIDSKEHHTHLLFGVTGSGKTEVYLQAIDYVRSLGKGVIFMVPEISLTTQTIERLKTRFSEKIAILHHRLSHGERHDMWHNIKKNKVFIVIGARSCIFAPLAHIGLIIVDEEHDSSYKQGEENPCYNARDLAILRASFTQAVVILGSATPSIESFTHAKKNKYILNTLSQRASSNHMPDIHIIDMNHEKEKTNTGVLFSQKLLSGIKTRLDKGEQTLLFLNRRGYHSIILCTTCEKALLCPHCDVSLTYHKKEHYVTCHYCGYTSFPPKTCSTCHKNTISYKGVGTEKVEASLKAVLPMVKTLRMDADTTRHKGSHDQIFREFRSGKADVLIGTQMISKGFDFPNVTLVGVLNSDSSLYIADFRAEELCFQLLTQVAGRSGRSDLKGEVLLQTYLKDHPIFHLASRGDYIGFYERELANRKLFHYPPFTRLAKLIFKGSSQGKTLDFAKLCHDNLVQALPQNSLIYPVISAFRSKMQDEYRYYFLIKSPSIRSISEIVKNFFEKHRFSQDIKVLIDIDPLQSSF